MPYIGLEEQGFYEPFRALAAAGQNFHEARRRKKLDAADEEDRQLRRKMIQSQMDASDWERRQKEQEAERLKTWTPRTHTTPDGEIFDEVAPGRFDRRPKKAPTVFDLTPPPSVQPPGAVAGPEQPQPTGQTPGRLPDLSLDGRGYRRTVKPDGTLGFEPVPEEETTKIELVPVPNGEPITAEVTRKGGNVTKITPVNVNRVDANKPIGDEALNKFNAASFALAQLPDIESAVNTSGTSGGPLEGRLRQLGNWVFGQNPTDLEFSNLSARTLAPIAKGILGETGVLTDQDIKRIEPLLPQYTDTEEVRKVKLEKLKTMLTEQATRWMKIMSAAGRKTGELEKTMAPLIEAGKGSDGGSPVQVNSQAEYDALPKGAKYIDSTGTTRTKQ